MKPRITVFFRKQIPYYSVHGLPGHYISVDVLYGLFKAIVLK